MTWRVFYFIFFVLVYSNVCIATWINFTCYYTCNFIGAIIHVCRSFESFEKKNRHNRAHTHTHTHPHAYANANAHMNQNSISESMEAEDALAAKIVEVFFRMVFVFVKWRIIEREFHWFLVIWFVLIIILLLSIFRALSYRFLWSSTLLRVAVSFLRLCFRRAVDTNSGWTSHCLSYVHVFIDIFSFSFSFFSHRRCRRRRRRRPSCVLPSKYFSIIAVDPHNYLSWTPHLFSNKNHKYYFGCVRAWNPCCWYVLLGSCVCLWVRDFEPEI